MTLRVVEQDVPTEQPRVPLPAVLAILDEFGEWGGASLSLTAWQLMRGEDECADAWEEARSQGLIEPTGEIGWDGQAFWRLVTEL